MPSNIRFALFKKMFERHEVVFKRCKGSHQILSRVVDGVEYVYPVPTVNGREVKYLYLAKARKAPRLTAKDGVPDSVFE